MDQDAFRKLLAGSRQSQPNAKLASHNTTNGALQKAGTSASSEPAFKPRKVKKTEGKYRDRAAERREGIGSDYADVEAVLDDFERRVAHEDKDVIEQQRKYLGGDSQHTILVKGLDTSLLEQNRARTAASTEDDDILEQAFAEATPTFKSTEPKKRTREDIIRDLKAKRQTEERLASQPEPIEGELGLEAAKKAGKFRPIGFKPIGQREEKPKKRRVKEGNVDGAKKKKQKVESTSMQPGMKTEPAKEMSAVSQEHDTAQPLSSKSPKKPPESGFVPLDEDLDIFAGAGDYQAFPDDVESEEGDLDAKATSAEFVTQDAVPAVGMKGWFDDTEPEVRDPIILPEKSPPAPETVATEEEPQDMRLKPLESSSLPSIRDFLAMDEAAEKAEKRKARKEKKKKKKAGDGDDDD